MASDNPFSGLRERMLDLYHKTEMNQFREPVFSEHFKGATLNGSVIYRASLKFQSDTILEDQRAHLQGLFLAYLEDQASSIYKEYFDKNLAQDLIPPPAPCLINLNQKTMLALKKFERFWINV